MEIGSLSKIFGQGPQAFRALNDVSVTVRRGEFFTLLGPSGCGKTTLLRLIAGFEQPSSGTLRIGGEEVAGLGPNRRPVNTVFQNYALFPHMSVADNIGFGLQMQGRPAAERRATVARMLKLVRMEAMADRRPTAISGGQQQRVALARALAPQPRVLLLDEPLSALDLKLRKEMQSELKRLQTETGITFVFVTHDQEEALTMSDRIAVMSEGHILQTGTPEEIYNRPADRFVADFIGDTNFLDAVLEDSAGSGAVVRLPGGARLAANLPAEGAPSPGATVTVVIRPEHARLVGDEAPGPPDEAAVLFGRVERSVFFGTDTHIHLRLPDGAPFILRRQNSAAGAPPPDVGAEVSVALAQGALQVLRG
ncbi:MAG: ABC transporter ATP-binding protein [Alkalilacustris sp.]